MAKFLLCWEIGGGLGHSGRLAPVAQRLAGRGHSVAIALREAQHGPTFFPGFRQFEAPRASISFGEMVVGPSTYADILHNAGGSNAVLLAQTIAAWRTVFDEFGPDVVVLDFSPLALLAAQGSGTRTALLATGHACPPDISPLPDCCPWRNNYPERLRRTESRVLDVFNRQLAAQGEPQLDRVAQIFSRANINLLTTFRELDHYPHRPLGRHKYVGVWSDLPAAEPDWPTGKGPRVFAYLKPSPLAALVFAELDRRGWPTLAYVPDADASGLPAERGSVRISRVPLDIRSVVRQCNLAILHSGHNATAQFLLAGTPVIAIPLTGEQQIVADNVVRMGAGELVRPERLDTFPLALDGLAVDTRYRNAAETFATRYSDWTSDRQLGYVVNVLTHLAEE